MLKAARFLFDVVWRMLFWFHSLFFTCDVYDIKAAGFLYHQISSYVEFRYYFEVIILPNIILLSSLYAHSVCFCASFMHIWNYCVLLEAFLRNKRKTI